MNASLSFSVFAFLCSAVALGQNRNALPTLVPAPQEIRWAAGAPAYLPVKDLQGACAASGCDKALSGLVHVNAKLRELQLPALEASDDAQGKIVLVAGPKDASRVSEVKGLPEPGKEGYWLLVAKGGVLIQGTDLAGCYYGLVTLSKLIDDQGNIPMVAISDWPDMPFRGTYIAGYADYEKQLLRFAALKLNHVMFESGELYELDDPQVKKRWQDIFSFCRRHFLDPIPELQSWGWGQHVLRLEPRVAEGITVEKRPFPVKNGEVFSPPPPVPEDVKVLNPGFERFSGHQMERWEQEQPGESTFVEKDEAAEGKASLRIQVPEKGTIRAWQDVECQEDVPYEVSCQLKTEDVKGHGAYIEVYGLTDDDKLDKLIGKPNRAFAGTQDWQKMAIRFQTGSYTRLRIYVRIQEGSGTAWFDEVAVRGVRPMNPLDNVMVTAAAPVTVMDKKKGTLYEEGKDFVVHPGKIAFPYVESTPLKVTIPQESRIQNGDTVLLSYHQAPEGSITCCPSDPVYQQFMRKSIHRAVRVLHPQYLHIGHDEPRIVNRDKRCTDRGLTDTEIFVDDVRRMHAYLKEADPKVKLMMWNDALDPNHGSGYHRVIGAADQLPKDIVICIWWYNWPDSDVHLAKSVPYFLEKGFHITGSPWFRRKNAYQWAEVLNQYGRHDPRVMGHLYTSWAHASEDPWGAIDVTAEYAWSFDKPPFK